MSKLTIALAKGRLQTEALEVFRRAGVRLGPEQLNSRRLLIEDEKGEYNFVFVKPADVPVYVEYGVADAGVCGRDVLLEHASDVHRPLDLRIGYCRIVVAGKKDELPAVANRFSTLRIATTHPRLDAILGRSIALDSKLLAKVAEIVEMVRRDGDRAICDLTQSFDGITLSPSNLRVEPALIKELASQVDQKLIGYIRRSIEN